MSFFVVGLDPQKNKKKKEIPPGASAGREVTTRRWADAKRIGAMDFAFNPPAGGRAVSIITKGDRGAALIRA